MASPLDENAERGSGAAVGQPTGRGAGSGGRRTGRVAVLAEWVAWLAIAWFFYRQTALFDETIGSYRYGATGWPRTLAVCVAIGATGQMLYRFFVRETAGPVAAAVPETTPWATRAQRIAILALPLVWLWFTPRIGFYVTTPLFIVALLLVLEVRSVRALLGVTAVVYGLVLLIFTRYFYVGLPVGSFDGFYEVNNWIVATVRWGV